MSAGTFMDDLGIDQEDGVGPRPRADTRHLVAIAFRVFGVIQIAAALAGSGSALMWLVDPQMGLSLAQRAVAAIAATSTLVLGILFVAAAPNLARRLVPSPAELAMTSSAAELQRVALVAVGAYLVATGAVESVVSGYWVAATSNTSPVGYDEQIRMGLLHGPATAMAGALLLLGWSRLVLLARRLRAPLEGEEPGDRPR